MKSILQEGKKKILIVDDEVNICELLKLYLEKEGYSTQTATNGDMAIKKFEEYGPDLVLLDIMLPKIDGWQVCKTIREKSKCLIIVVSAKDETFDKVLGLELGADDYVVKPFDPKEVVARIKALLRRISLDKNENRQQKKIIKLDNICINLTNYELDIKGEKVDTPPKELELIYFLASHPNQVFTRDVLLEKIWGYEYYYGDSRTVDVHVKRLREKLEGASDKWRLKTVWGVGYKFEVDGQE